MLQGLSNIILAEEENSIIIHGIVMQRKVNNVKFLQRKLSEMGLIKSLLGCFKKSSNPSSLK